MSQCTWEKVNKVSGRERQTTYKAECTSGKVIIQSTVIIDVDLQYDKPFNYCPYCGDKVSYG